jgi:DMSO/TMAO reductase YedYZ heme-binding membrane subunit
MFTSSVKYKTIILIGSVVGSIGLFFLSQALFPLGSLRIIRLEEWYGFAALWFLFAAVTAGPLYRVYPTFLGKDFYRKCLGGLGISSFYFGLLHGSINFFVLLQGFKGLAFLGPFHLAAVIFGFTALCIITVMAATSFTGIVNLLGSRWKIIHRFVYFALALLVVHIIIMGTHFHDFSSLATLLTFVWFMVILSLYALATRNALMNRFTHISRSIVTVSVAGGVLLIMYGMLVLHLFVMTSHMH